MLDIAKLKDRYWQNPAGDAIGGLMAAIVALPLCLAFGVASGLGAAAGLYGAIACGIFAALFGGTPGQCSGPTGPMTVVAASILSANSGRPEIIFAATITCGFIQLAMGFAKLGQLIGYIPYPVISGFMTGIGAIIVCIELGPLFGLPAAGNALSGLELLGALTEKFNFGAFVVSALTLAIIYLLPLLSKKLPASLVALTATTALVQILNLEVPKIGQIPSTLPLPKFPGISVDEMHVVIQNGLTLAVLGSIDTLLTSLVLDKVTRRRHDSDVELIGQGIGNLTAGMIGGLPGAGATMRSMVNVRSGGTTSLSGILHGLILLAVLVVFSNAASQIPLACLAAILLSVGLSIMDWRVLRTIKKTPKSDVFVMLTVLALTIFVDLIVAVLAGVALACVLFVKQLSDARLSSFSDLETLEELREVTEHIPESIRKSTFSYVLNGPLFFGEAKNLTDAIDKLADAKYIILRFANVPLIDQTGAFALETAIEKWQENGIKVLLVGIPPHIQKALEDIGAGASEANCFERFEKAIDAIDLWETKAAGDWESGAS